MDEILKKIESLEQRIFEVERRLGAPGVLPSAEPPLPPAYIGEKPVQKQWWNIPSTREVLGGERKNVESYIGRWVLGAIGVVAVVFGASFFLKYAFESDLIGEVGRVMLGVFGGLVFIGLGEWLRSRFAKYSYILSAGGLALLYLSVYGAFWFYELISQGAAFGFMIAVTVFGVVLSLWADALILAALSSATGFLVPFLLSTGVANDFGFFSYLVVLNLGILAVAFFKKWHPLTLVGFVGTVLNFASWYGGYYESEKLFFTIYILGIFFTVYLLTGFFANIATRKMSDSADLFVLTINPVWTFGWYYFLLKPQYEDSLGFVAVGFGALYILFAYCASVMRREDVRLTLFLGAIAVVFLTVAVPLQLEGNAITIAWAAEAAVLFVLGVFLKNKGMRIFSLGVFAIALIRLFAFDSDIQNVVDFVPIFNARFFTYFMTIAAAAIMGYTAYAGQELLSAFEGGKSGKAVLGFLGAVINILVLAAVTLDIFTFFEARLIEAGEQFQERAVLEAPARVPQTKPGYEYDYSYQQRTSFYASDGYRSILNQRNASISVFWTILAVILITLGMLYRNAYLRWSALILFGVTIVKVFILDLAGLKTPYRIISFMALGIILLLASYLYFRYQKRLEETQRAVL
ncbi:MAG: hypothetical protein A3C07_00335 [Candidatus Sungbacteria bacterium RIFCSPHIGHO2_02_FULL_47_11]|uniref:DUF2339 domain-containing protein n=1 Tax=Candidatus Sungbacteria bacterium RIFCSPHIGHO2_02_FULL_47_11 TaxID=1802270 RepID=A0A1G2KJN4_9BACT|nr:MAG: hypothetical protein A3C07_00335 [Candidatus Sungbacteria bacterium RIFCSPHIGHO2_02_FULL_47_11]